MLRHRRNSVLSLWLFVFIAASAFLVVAPATAAFETTISQLASETHFHGLAVDTENAEHLLLATHHGLFRIAPDGTAQLVSDTRDDFMGFTVDPVNSSVLFASGHPARGGNLGFIASQDGGKTWVKLADGVKGPVDFHQMDVSIANPKVIYGVYGAIQRSDDGGKTWRVTGRAPEGLIDLAASAVDADVIYAATKNGLQKSGDAGRTWQPIHREQAPATMIHMTRSGDLYAFTLNSGLMRASEQDLRWQQAGTLPAAWAIMHLAVDAENTATLYGAVRNLNSGDQALLISRDGGRAWKRLGER